MKKISIFVLVCILLTGCGKEEKIACSIRNEEEKNNTKVEFVFKKEAVLNATATMTYDDEENAKNMCSIFKTAYNDKVECQDKTVTINNYHEILEDDYDTKEKIVNYYKEHNYTCE